MSQDEPSGPDLDGVVADANAVGLSYVVIGAHHLSVKSRHGIVDIMRGGLPSVVGFKRLAGRPQDKRDLEELESLHGELPIEPIPGLD